VLHVEDLAFNANVQTEPVSP